jgi:uncharacterized membrane protein YeaQ/YmgE (transglycosylase-associated protein family)
MNHLAAILILIAGFIFGWMGNEIRWRRQMTILCHYIRGIDGPSPPAGEP